jgi:hypothetical protein
MYLSVAFTRIPTQLFFKPDEAAFEVLNVVVNASDISKIA